MEHCYRIALWMFFVIACIQAMPTPQCSVPTMDDLGLDRLHEAKCGNVTFLSQAKVEANNSEAIKCIFYELEKASNNCTDENLRIHDTLMSLDNLINCTQSAATLSSDCQWTTRKTFPDFVKDVETFFEKQRN